MTNRDRLLSLLGFAPADRNAADGALIDAGIDGTALYTADMIIPIKKCAIEVLQILLSSANTSNSVTSFTVTYDRNAVLTRIKELKADCGIVDAEGPVINAPAVW
jgi:hypothetical protein